MSSCFSIRLLNRSNFSTCDKYRIIINDDGYVYIKYITCSGNEVIGTFTANEVAELCVFKDTVPTQDTLNTSTGTIDSISYIGPCASEDSDEEDDLYLDLFPDFSLRETKVLTELTAVDTLNFSYTLGFDIPNKDSNNFEKLKTFFNPNVLDNEYNEIEVEVKTGSHIISESKLYVKGCDKDKISVELRISVNHWARKSKDLKLCDLPYNIVEFNCDHIKDVISNQYPYIKSANFNDTNNLGIYYPLVNYGRTIQDNSDGSPRSNQFIVPIEFWRPWYYISGLLQRGFCRLGWSYESPLFDSEFGRKLITYIGNKQYGLNNLTDLSVKANVENPYLFQAQYYNDTIGTIRFPNISIDPTSSLSPITGIYKNGGEIKYRGKIIFKSASSKKSDVTIRIMKIDTNSSSSFFGGYTYDSIEFKSIGNDSQEWEFEIDSISTTTVEDLAIVMERRHSDAGSQNTLPAIIIESGSFLEIEGIRRYFKEGDDLDLRSFIDCNYTFLDFIKGLSRIFNLKFKTNYSTRTVHIYTPYDADFWGDSIEGFYIEEFIEDIGYDIDPKSKVVTTPDLSTPRFHKLSFKKSTDHFIKSLNLSDELWSKKIDLGEKFTINETQEYANIFFEPTLNRNGIFNNSFAMHTPMLTNDSEYGWNINPRILIARGNVIQDFDVIASPTIRYCTYEDDTTELIPTASQFTPIRLGAIHNDLSSPTLVPEDNLVFEVNKEINEYDVLKSLYHLVYKRWFLEQLNNLKINYLVNISLKAIVELDFRKYYTFYHLGRPVVARISAVNDYHYCRNLMTPVDFIPQRQLSNLCDLLPDNNGEGGDDNTPLECRNDPVILCSVTGSCYTFTLGGSNNAPIDTVIFEYKLVSDTSWTQLSNITPISAQICDITEDFLIRAIVSYDIIEGIICPTITLPEKLIQPCPDLDLEFECVNVWVSAGSGQFTLGVRTRLILPDNNYNITVIDSTVNIDSVVTIPYLQTVDDFTIWGEILTNGSLFDFSITFKINNCLPITLNKLCDIPQSIPTPDCSQISLELACEQIASGCFIFNKIGYLPFDFEDYVKYRCSDDGINWGPWKFWDEETPICCNYIQGRWFVHFCDDACPFTCSPIVQCNCTNFETDQVLNLALCNNGNI